MSGETLSTELSPRQADCLRAAYAHLMREGRPPTVRELARAMGVTHNTVAFSHDGSFLAALLRKGWVELDRCEGRKPFGTLGGARKGAPLARAWRLRGLGWETVGDGQGGVRRIPFCEATPEGLRLAAVLAAPGSRAKRRGRPSRRVDPPARAG